MAGQCPTTGLPEAGDQVDHPGWEAHLVDHFGELQQRGGRLLGGLDHHGVAGCQSRADLGRCEEHLGVPRDDGGHHPDGLADGKNVKVRLVDWESVTLDFVGQPGVVAVVVGHVGRLAPGFDGQLAGVSRLDFAEVGGPTGYPVGEFEQQTAPVGCRHGGPVASGQGTPGCHHGPIYVGLCGSRSGCPYLSVRRVHRIKPPAVRGLAELAVDVEPVVGHEVASRSRNSDSAPAKVLGASTGGRWCRPARIRT